MRCSSSIVRHFCPLLFAMKVLGIAPLPPIQQMYHPSNSSRSSLPSIADLLSANRSYSTPSSHSLHGTNIQCLRGRYGTIDNPESCLKAFHDIPTDSKERYTFGLRSLGFFEVQLPHRFLSRTSLWVSTSAFAD